MTIDVTALLPKKALIQDSFLLELKFSLKENIGYYFKLGNSYQSYNDVFILN
jgi:hypothetical protein